jgi:hypothetical protein
MNIFNDLLIGMKVKPTENHPYLDITKRMVGRIKDVTNDGQISVEFKKLKRTIVFCSTELERVKHGNSKNV